MRCTHIKAVLLGTCIPEWWIPPHTSLMAPTIYIYLVFRVLLYTYRCVPIVIWCVCARGPPVFAIWCFCLWWILDSRRSRFRYRREVIGRRAHGSILYIYMYDGALVGRMYVACLMELRTRMKAIPTTKRVFCALEWGFGLGYACCLIFAIHNRGRRQRTAIAHSMNRVVD